MECKNCRTNLSETAEFCEKCGRKVINHRLNFKTVTAEFLETYISWDNKFFKTFIHLITKPQVVANGYLNGVRKRYMQPFAYMLIILSLYGIYLLLAKEQMLTNLETLNYKGVVNPNPKTQALQENFNKKWISFLTNYFSLFTFMTIPFFAFINKIIFKKNNFIEHNVSLLYAYATYSLISIFIGSLGLIFSIKVAYLSSFSLFIMIFYHVYFYKKMYNLDIGDTILKTLLFWIGMLIYLIVFSIIGFIIVIILMKLHIIPIPK